MSGNNNHEKTVRLDAAKSSIYDDPDLQITSKGFTASTKLRTEWICLFLATALIGTGTLFSKTSMDTYICLVFAFALMAYAAWAWRRSNNNRAEEKQSENGPPI